MYQVEIQNTVEAKKEFIVAAGEQMVDQNMQLSERATYDEVTGDPILDGNGDPVMEAIINSSGQDVPVSVNKSAQEIADEEQALKDEKAAEVQAKLDAYMAAQEHQRQNGGPGPVADFEIMKICNEHSCQFEVVFKVV